MNTVQMQVRKIEGIFTLDHCVKLIVPSTVDIDQAMDNSDIVDRIVEQFSIAYGGATVHQAKGAWFSGSLDRTVVEDVTIIESFCTEDAAIEHMDSLFQRALWVKEEMAQEAVSVIIDGELHLV